MEIVVLCTWFFLAVLVGIYAGNRGRMGFGWFVLAVMFSPLLIWLLLLVLGSGSSGGSAPIGAGVNPRTHVRCPDCREYVYKDARKCKHCGTALIPQ